MIFYVVFVALYGSAATLFAIGINWFCNKLEKFHQCNSEVIA